jgi:hypothetical protein
MNRRLFQSSDLKWLELLISLSSVTVPFFSKWGRNPSQCNCSWFFMWAMSVYFQMLNSVCYPAHGLSREGFAAIGIFCFIALTFFCSPSVPPPIMDVVDGLNVVLPKSNLTIRPFVSYAKYKEKCMHCVYELFIFVYFAQHSNALHLHEICVATICTINHAQFRDDPYLSSSNSS